MKIKNYFLGGMLAVIGLLMVIIPETCIKTVVILVGAATAVNGVYTFLKFYKNSEDKLYKRTVLVKFLTSLIVGIIAVFFPLLLMNTVKTIWTIITYVLAIFFVLYAVSGFFSSSLIKDLSAEDKKRITQESFIYLLIAIVLFIIPAGSIMQTLFRIVGVLGLIFGFVIIIREIIVSKNQTEVAVEETETDKE